MGDKRKGERDRFGDNENRVNIEIDREQREKIDRRIMKGKKKFKLGHEQNRGIERGGEREREREREKEQKSDRKKKIETEYKL